MEGGVEDRTPVTLAAEHEGDAPDEGLDDFASLAESYLLADPSLAHEFAVSKIPLLHAHPDSV